MHLTRFLTKKREQTVVFLKYIVKKRVRNFNYVACIPKIERKVRIFDTVKLLRAFKNESDPKIPLITQFRSITLAMYKYKDILERVYCVVVRTRKKEGGRVHRAP